MINANLLPPELKQEITQSKENAKAVRFFWQTILLLLVAVAISGGLWYYYQRALNTKGEALTNQEKALDKYGNLEAKAKKLSERLTAIKKINTGANVWSDVISEVQKVMPSGVYLSSVRIDSSEKVRNQISGVAKSKQEVATLRDSMEKSPKFEYVDIESSVTSVGQAGSTGDVENFAISFSLSKGALK